MKILITGGAGFIGSYLTNTLNDNGHEVYIIDNLSQQVHGKDFKESYLYQQVKDISTVIHEDIINSVSLQKIIKEIDIVVHLAAETGTGQSMYDIGNYVKTNSMGTAFLLESILKNENRIKKFILASSRSVYGEGEYLCTQHGVVYPNTRNFKDMDSGDFNCKCPICNKNVVLSSTKEESRINPLSIYALTKYNQEQLVSVTCNSINLPFTIFRFQNVYGLGQSLINPYTGILAIFSKLILEGKEINIFEDGHESRDFVHVTDVVNAIYTDILSDILGQIYNVGSGKSTSVIEIVSLLKDFFPEKVKYRLSGTFRVGDIRSNFADLKKIKELLNFEPKIHLKDGISELIEWVKKSKLKSDSKSFEESIEEMKKYNLLINK